MGNDQKEVRRLRQVNVNTGPVSAVSESMNASQFVLKQTETAVDGVTVASPVMKDLGALQDFRASLPKETDVADARKAAGLKFSSNASKRERETTAARREYVRQNSLYSHKQQWLALNYQKPPKSLNCLSLFLKTDLSVFMFDKQKGDVYDKLIDSTHDNYATLQKLFALIPDFESEIQTKLQAAFLTPQDREELVQAQAKLKTLYDIQAYYEVREQIMLNKYFATLPQDKMEKLSYDELRVRLDKLYSDPKHTQDPNIKDLIAYYQNLIRLKELNLSDGKSVLARQQEYEVSLKGKPATRDTRKPKDVIKQIQSAYEDLEKRLNDPNSIMNAHVYRERFLMVFGPDIEKFIVPVQDSKLSDSLKKLKTDYEVFAAHPTHTEDMTQKLMRDGKPQDKSALEKSDSSAEGISLSADQIEGVRRVSAYLMRKAGEHTTYVYNILQAPPEQQLVIFYLVENKKESSSRRIDYFSALNNYQPSEEKFKDGFSWTRLSSAVRSSMSISEDMKQYGVMTKAISEVSDTIAKFNDPNAQQLTNSQKASTIIDAIKKRGALLKMLYRSAGLHDEMPPDMAEDPVLRRRMFDEYREILVLVQKLATVDPQASVSDADYAGVQPLKEKEAPGQQPEGAAFDTVKEKIDGINTYGGFVDGEIEGIMNSLTGDVLPFMDAQSASGVHVFDTISGGIGGLVGLFGFVGAAMQAHAIRMSADELTTADHVAQSIDVSGDFVNSVGGLISAGSGIAMAVYDTAEAGAHITFDASQAIWQTAYHGTNAAISATAKAVMAGGALAVIGGTVKTAASCIQLRRALSNQQDVEDAGKTIAQKRANKTPLSTEEEKLELFLQHQERATQTEYDSAAFGVATGVLTTVAGALSFTGFLAPLGAVVGVAAVTTDIVGRVVSHKRKQAERRKTVDSMLDIDHLTDLLRNDAQHPLAGKISGMDDDTLKEKVREEALAMLGYSSYDECYRDICAESAALLYHKVFEINPKPADYQDYYKAMSSLGMRIKEDTTGKGKHKPSIDAMITKMMG